MQSEYFAYKSGFFYKNCYKVSLWENLQQQSCKAFTGLSNSAQVVGEGHFLLPEILCQIDSPPSKCRLLFDICLLCFSWNTYQKSSIITSRKL